MMHREGILLLSSHHAVAIVIYIYILYILRSMCINFYQQQNIRIKKILA